VAIRAKYFLQVHPLVISEDLTNLPMILRVCLSQFYSQILILVEF
jgi:hypothetical protein